MKLSWAAPGLVLAAGAIVAALGEPQSEPKLAPGSRPPEVLFGRRVIPAEADRRALRDLDLPALEERLKPAAADPGGAGARDAAYTLLLWNLHSILSTEDDDARADLYAAAETLYRSLLAEAARPATPDPELESNVSFLIGAAWVAWKGSLDPLSRTRLQRSVALREGHYRLAAEMLVERTPFQPGLEPAVGRILEGDPASALPMVEAVLKRKKDDPDALYWKGVALLRLGRHTEALGPLDGCLALRPGDGAAHEARAAARCGLRDWKGALADWEAALVADVTARGRLLPFIEAARRSRR